MTNHEELASPSPELTTQMQEQNVIVIETDTNEPNTGRHMIPRTAEIGLQPSNERFSQLQQMGAINIIGSYSEPRMRRSSLTQRDLDKL